MRLIDADETARHFSALQEGASMRDHIYLMGVLSVIDNAPTIEAEPVRHGRWVHDDLGHTYCSGCHERIPYIHCYSDEPNSDWDEEWDEEMPESAYCSHCGAKMDAKEEDTCD